MQASTNPKAIYGSPSSPLLPIDLTPSPFHDHIVYGMYYEVFSYVVCVKDECSLVDLIVSYNMDAHLSRADGHVFVVGDHCF